MVFEAIRRRETVYCLVEKRNVLKQVGMISDNRLPPLQDNLKRRPMEVNYGYQKTRTVELV